MGETKFCEKCGRELNKEADVCLGCGTMIKKNTEAKKDPVLALVLSFLLTGLGQVYNGQVGKGFLYLMCAIVSVALMSVGIGFIIWPIVIGFSCYDAYKEAQRINDSQ